MQGSKENRIRRQRSELRNIIHVHLYCVHSTILSFSLLQLEEYNPVMASCCYQLTHQVYSLFNSMHLELSIETKTHNPDGWMIISRFLKSESQPSSHLFNHCHLLNSLRTSAAGRRIKDFLPNLSLSTKNNNPLHFHSYF